MDYCRTHFSQVYLYWRGLEGLSGEAVNSNRRFSLDHLSILKFLGQCAASSITIYKKWYIPTIYTEGYHGLFPVVERNQRKSWFPTFRATSLWDLSPPVDLKPRRSFCATWHLFGFKFGTLTYLWLPHLVRAVPFPMIRVPTIETPHLLWLCIHIRTW